jgi:hypothetical protein
MMCFGPFKRKKIKKEDLRRPGGMKVGITAFGAPSRYKILKGISEFQSFIEDNSYLKIDIWFVQENNLPAGEIPPYEGRGCYMVTPESLSSDSKGRMPSGMKTDIVVYDTQLRDKCYGGLTWGHRNPPFICIPYNNHQGWDSGWKTSLAPTLVHEFTHALYHLLEAQGILGLPNIDRAHDYPYTEEGADPGWIIFRKWCLGKITQEMAATLMAD